MNYNSWSGTKICISPADKGGAVVVQNFEDYKKEVLRQFDNLNNYQRLQENPTTNIAQHSNSFFERLHDNGSIDDHCYTWGLVDIGSIRTLYFYHLPKVHKDKNNPPGRPIVSGVNGPTEKLSKLVDHWRHPVVHSLPSFIPDTTHFLQMIEQWKRTYKPLPPEAVIVTLDVVRLYSNIPHHEVTHLLWRH